MRFWFFQLAVVGRNNVYTVNIILQETAMGVHRVARVPDITQKILRIATDLYLKEGLSGISMRRIAKKMRLTPMAIYRHYENKEQLLAALVSHGFDVFLSYQQRASEGSTVSEKFRLAGEYYLDFALEQPKYYKIVFLSPEIYTSMEMPRHLVEKAHASFQTLVDRVSEAIAEGLFRADDPLKLATAIWGMSHGLTTLYISGMLQTEPENFRKIFHESFERFMRGILVDDM